MRSVGTTTTAILLAVNVFGGLSMVPAAQATTKEDVALNGTYRATSIGNLAQINEQFNNEATVTSTWTLNSSCTNFQECTGSAKSDQGWSAPMHTLDGEMWYVRRDVPNWERCQDGPAFTGQQTFYFYPVESSTGAFKLGSPVLAGKDKTVGPSGACGQNRQLSIELPLRLDKLA